MLTDYLLGIWAFYLALRLYPEGKATRQKCTGLWSLFLFATGIAALIGGTAHGFDPYFTDRTREIIWKSTLYFILIASFFFLAGSIVAFFQGLYKRLFLIAATVKFALFSIWIVSNPDFKFAIYDYAGSMAIVLILQVTAKIKSGEKSAAWIIAGIVISLIGAAVQQSGIDLHEHFNHNDLYHVIQIVVFYLWYRGARLLRDG
ncbi:MAG: hypothetical protein V1794_04750 [Candidatus Glassbacteria bacterium]